MSTPCDGSGRLPCTCGAASWNANLDPWSPRRTACTCDPTATCPGCEKCRTADAERAKRHAETSAWYHAKIGTAPPKQKAGRAGEAKAADPQGRLKLEG